MNSKKVSTATPAKGGARSPIPERATQVGSVLRWARETLSPSPTASLDAQLLLAYVLDQQRSWVLAHPDDVLGEEIIVRYRELISRRATGVPVAYLRGYCEWYGLTLRVTPDVLVPRPETELLVEEAVTIARQQHARRLVDVGTGSGAIAIQLALSLPDAGITGIDVSREALRVARSNAGMTGTGDRITWLEGNLLEPLVSEPDLLVANLPYLADSMMSDRGPDVRHEPDIALYGGVTGLELYRELFEQRRERGWSMPMVLEIDPRQSTDLTTMLRMEFFEEAIRIRPDYAGLDRMVVVRA